VLAFTFPTQAGFRGQQIGNFGQNPIGYTLYSQARDAWPTQLNWCSKRQKGIGHLFLDLQLKNLYVEPELIGGSRIMAQFRLLPAWLRS
jgi:hypothetical protein